MNSEVTWFKSVRYCVVVTVYLRSVRLQIVRQRWRDALDFPPDCKAVVVVINTRIIHEFMTKQKPCYQVLYYTCVRCEMRHCYLTGRMNLSRGGRSFVIKSIHCSKSVTCCDVNWVRPWHKIHEINNLSSWVMQIIFKTSSWNYKQSHVDGRLLLMTPVSRYVTPLPVRHIAPRK